MPLLPLGVTLLWHALSVMECVKPTGQCGKLWKSDPDNLLG